VCSTSQFVDVPTGIISIKGGDTSLLLTLYPGNSGDYLSIPGTISKIYVWYVIRIHLEFPRPAQTISFSSIAREGTPVKTPIGNPKGHLVG
jgi:hypothetical protein